jgi:hypothetical protein
VEENHIKKIKLFIVQSVFVVYLCLFGIIIYDENKMFIEFPGKLKQYIEYSFTNTVVMWLNKYNE